MFIFCVLFIIFVFVIIYSVGNVVLGGFIFFGDLVVGYIMVYIFCILDVYVCGYKWVYVFLVLLIYCECFVMKIFGYVVLVFRDMVIWI